MASVTMSKTAIIALAVVIAVGLVAAIAYFLMAGGNDDEDQDSTWRSGDFVEWGQYDVPLSSQPQYPQYVHRYTIEDVMSDRMFINRSTYFTDSILWSWAEGYIDNNVTGFGYSYENLMGRPYDISYLGIDSVEIVDYGTVSAEHYQYNYTYGETLYTVDVWVRNGFILAQQTISDTFIELFMIHDTNIEKIFA